MLSTDDAQLCVAAVRDCVEPAQSVARSTRTLGHDPVERAEPVIEVPEWKLGLLPSVFCAGLATLIIDVLVPYGGEANSMSLGAIARAIAIA